MIVIIYSKKVFITVTTILNVLVNAWTRMKTVPTTVRVIKRAGKVAPVTITQNGVPMRHVTQIMKFLSNIVSVNLKMLLSNVRLPVIRSFCHVIKEKGRKFRFCRKQVSL